MQKLFLSLAVVLSLVLPTIYLSAFPRSHSQMAALKHRHKQERKMLREQQRAVKRVMAQHYQSAEARQRFKHDMKMQRELLQKKQKEETRKLKEIPKPDKAHPRPRR
jgi:small-conductance mechanosensitive channel